MNYGIMGALLSEQVWTSNPQTYLGSNIIISTLT